MTKTKRIHHFVNKNAIAISIKLYNSVQKAKTSQGVSYGETDLWEVYWASLANICPGNSWSVTCSLSSIFQAMYWANTLTVDRVYELILASGINTTEEYIDE